MGQVNYTKHYSKWIVSWHYSLFQLLEQFLSTLYRLDSNFLTLYIILILGPKKAPKSTMQEAAEKVAANRTDFRVGVEGSANKSFQEQP